MLGDDVLERREVVPPTGGRGVPAVRDRVGDGLDVAVARQFDQRVEVLVVGVDPTIADEADEVYLPVVCAGVVERGVDRVVLPEGAVSDRVRDPGVLLVDHASGADIEVADLAVTHLAVGEADAPARDLERPVRAGVGEPIEIRRFGGCYGVSARSVAESPPVEDDQRSVHVRRVASRS